MQKGLFKCNRKKIKILIKDLKEDTNLLELSKVQLIDKIRKLINSNKKLRREIKELRTTVSNCDSGYHDRL